MRKIQVVGDDILPYSGPSIGVLGVMQKFTIFFKLTFFLCDVFYVVCVLF